MYNNILHQLLAKSYSNSAESFPADRCNGLSTGIALEALGKAMQRPRTRQYISHHVVSHKADVFTVRLAESIVGRLHMVGFTFKREPGPGGQYYVEYNLEVPK